MKKYFISIGTFFISLMLISTVTAVPNNQSEPVMNVINDIEDKKNFIDNDISFDNLININPDGITGGIFDLLIQLIRLIIELVMELISVIQNIISLVNLISSLINAFNTLFQLIQELIALLGNIFNPSQVKN